MRAERSGRVSQQERRRNPYPWTWEPAAAVLTSLALVVMVGLQAGRTVANGLVTGHWQLAAPATWVVTLPDLLAGDAATGLEPRPPVVVSAPVLWAVAGLVELVLLLLTALALRWGWRRWSPWRPRGFADPAEVDRVLGLRRLRRTAHFIRPDLHHEPRKLP